MINQHIKQQQEKSLSKGAAPVNTIILQLQRTYMIGQRRLCRTRSISLRAHGWWRFVCQAEPAKGNHPIAIGFSFFHLFCDCESQELLSLL